MQTTWSCDCKHLCPTMHANDAEFSDMRSFNVLKTQYNESIRNYVPVLQSYQLRQLNWLSRIQHKADSKWCAEITKIYKYTIQSVVSVHTLRLLDKTKYKKSFKAALCNCVCGSLSKTSISIQKTWLFGPYITTMNRQIWNSAHHFRHFKRGDTRTQWNKPRQTHRRSYLFV